MSKNPYCKADRQTNECSVNLHTKTGCSTCYFFVKNIQMNKLQQALSHLLWQEHNIVDVYTMDGAHELWRIAYYPIFANGKTGEEYEEPRALIERPIKGGIDFREVPLRYLKKQK